MYLLHLRLKLMGFSTEFISIESLISRRPSFGETQLPYIRQNISKSSFKSPFYFTHGGSQTDNSSQNSE